MTTSTATRDDLVALATFPLTRPGENTVPVRMQTEHLAAVESDLAERGVPAEIVEKHFIGLHRCDELQLELWIGILTDAHNLATATAAQPSHVAALPIERAAHDPIQPWVHAAPHGPATP